MEPESSGDPMRGHRVHKVDANHAAVIKALRDAGFSAVSTAAVGNGFPDIVVGTDGLNLILEVKDGSKCKSGQLLTEPEVKFFSDWKGFAVVVNSPEQAVIVVRVYVGLQKP